MLEEGETFEKVGVNFSDVTGTALPEAATERHPELAGQPFTAMGVSIVSSSAESLRAHGALQRSVLQRPCARWRGSVVVWRRI